MSKEVACNKINDMVKYLNIPYDIMKFDVINDEKNCFSHYLVEISGGNNGKNDWLTYLFEIRRLFVMLNYEFTDVWLVKIENDCPDDIHYITIGVR